MSNLKRREAVFIPDLKEKNQILTNLSDPENAYLLAIHLHYKRSVCLKDLTNETHFTKQEIQCLYRNFKNNSANTIIHRDFVRNIYMNMFHGDTEHYADLIFNTFDVGHTGIVSFEQFLRSLSTLLRGDLNEKLEWIYPLYDPLKTGYVSWERIFYLVTAIDDLIGIEKRRRMTKEERCQITNKVFQKFDLEHSKAPIPKEKFLEICKKDELICKSINNIINSI